jgi:para-aminobenzoate synthetase component 1
MFARRLQLDFDGRCLNGLRPFAQLDIKNGAWSWQVAASHQSTLMARDGSGDCVGEIRRALQLCAAQSTLRRGAAIGFWSYDFARTLEPRAFSQRSSSDAPRDDLQTPDVRLVFCEALESVTAPAHSEANAASSIVASEDLAAPDAEYRAAFARIRDYIAAGDIYQANLTRRFSIPLRDSPAAIYARLRHSHPTPFSALLEWDDLSIVSNSPERFVRLRGRELLVQPIKGTSRRGADDEEDKRLRVALQSSTKDRAENVMVVDLMRHDLGRVCEYGSVRVPDLWRVQTFVTLHHLVSSVTGTLRADCDAVEALKTLFPCGSITGAPKLRAMQIIEELETARRGAAMGAIGYFAFDGDMEWSVAIRTISCRDGQAFFHVGGGIVWDSEVEAEWREMRLKAQAMRAALSASVALS